MVRPPLANEGECRPLRQPLQARKPGPRPREWPSPPIYCRRLERSELREPLTTAPPHPPGRRLPLWLKLGYTLFTCLLVPVYWRSYGPANFLWFCDAALLITLVALWMESPLLIGVEALATTLPQTVWILDFLTGGRLLGISAYMFNPGIALYVRVLSTFHIWLPPLLVWLVWRLGYDRRAFWFQSLIAVELLLASYLLTDPRHPPTQYPAAAVNVNRVFGPGPTQVQTWMPAVPYLLLQIALYPLCIYLPTHVAFRRLFPPPRSGRRGPLTAQRDTKQPQSRCKSLVIRDG